MNCPIFFDRINLKGSPLTSKTASGYFGQLVRYWVKVNVPRFEKIHLARTKKAPSKLPASAGNFAGGTVHLRPLQVFLHSPVLQCMSTCFRLSLFLVQVVWWQSQLCSFVKCLWTFFPCRTCWH